MRRTVRLAPLFLLALFALPTLTRAASAALPPPAVRFEPRAVVAEGVTAHGRLVWFSVAREVANYSTSIVPRQELAEDDDGDGVVRLELGEDIPQRSVWFALDLATGEVTAAAPEGFALDEVKLPPRAIVAALNRLDLAGELVYLLFARPGIGAWTLSLGDGGAGDDDGESDGTVRARLAAFQPLGASPPPPATLVPGDVLLAIDPDRMRYAVVHHGR